MPPIGKLSVAVTANSGGLTRGLDAAAKRIEGFSKKVGSIGSKVGVAAGALAAGGAAAAVGGLTLLTKRSFGTVDAQAKLADQIGISQKALGGLQHAAELTGAGSQTLNTGLKNMTRRLGEAVAGGGQASSTLARLGLDANELASATPDAAFGRIADRINDLPTAAEKASAAYGVFGRQGQDLLNTLALGSSGIASQVAAADRLGLSVTRVDASKIEQANDAITRLGSVFVGVGNSIAVGVAPFVEAAATKVAAFAVVVRDRIGSIGPAVAARLQGIWETTKTVFAAIYNFVAPVMSQYAQTVFAAMKAVGGIFSGVFKAIGRLIAPFVEKIGGVGDATSSMRDTIVSVLAAAEFAFTNWKDIAEHAGNRVAHRVVSLGGIIKHHFTQRIPAYLKWFAENWRSIVGDIVRSAMTRLKNLTGNIGRIFSNLGGLISGRVDFGDVWTPLDEGFVATTQALPKIAKREIGPLEKAFKDAADKSGAALAGGLRDHTREALSDSRQTKGIFSGLGAEVDAARKDIEGLPSKANPAPIRFRTTIDDPAIDRLGESLGDTIGLRITSAVGAGFAKAKGEVKQITGNQLPRLTSKADQRRLGIIERLGNRDGRLVERLERLKQREPNLAPAIDARFGDTVAKILDARERFYNARPKARGADVSPASPSPQPADSLGRPVDSGLPRSGRKPQRVDDVHGAAHTKLLTQISEVLSKRSFPAVAA